MKNHCLIFGGAGAVSMSTRPVCEHPEGRHCEVLAFDERTCSGTVRHAPCCVCGCRYYMTPRGVG